MNKILSKYFENSLFKNFFRIDLTNSEKNTAYESLNDKYSKGVAESLFLGLLAFPAILFMDVSILVSVLIPITMVSGTAWFAVSLINIKKKFENFGNELTKDLYRSFCTSIILLTLIGIVSMNPNILESLTVWGKGQSIVLVISGILGSIVVIQMIYDVFSGATKYDMNDSMLTGQNEAADKYFKRSLSLLNSSAKNLRDNGNNIGSSAYYISLAFFEVFNYIKQTRGLGEDIENKIKYAKQLKLSLPNSLEELRNVAKELIDSTLTFITNTYEKNTLKSFNNIKQELQAIEDNSNEDLAILNLRISTIIEELEDMLISQGEALFTKRMEIERKFLVNEVPYFDENVIKEEIIQGYIVVNKDEEERVRRSGDKYFHTFKKTNDNGYREETETNITKEQFNELWEKTNGKRIHKTRYSIPLQDDLVAQVDVFDDKNKGLVLAEVEFASEIEARTFKPLAWMNKEVTNNPKYKNSRLAQ